MTIRVGGGPPLGEPGADVRYRGLFYPDGDEITKNMDERLGKEPFYQADKYAMAMLHVKQHRVAVDVGAHIGAWTRELCKVFGKVIAIDPNPNNARVIALNAPQAKVMQVAVGNVESSTIGIAKHPDGPHIHTRVVNDDEAQWIVPLLTIDQILRDVPGVDFLKVHVNGMELEALRGARNTLRTQKPVLMVVVKKALADFGASHEDVHAFLAEDAGYVRIGGEKPYEVWGPK